MNSFIITTPEDLEALIAKVLDNHLKATVPTTPAAVPKEIINTTVLCERLGVSEPTAIAMRKRGRIPFLQVGAAIRYEWNSVLQALEHKKAR